jgi:hypothetical protein
MKIVQFLLDYIEYIIGINLFFLYQKAPNWGFFIANPLLLLQNQFLLLHRNFY